MKDKLDKIVVFDCGGRGGLHVSWDRFPVAIDYFSFEPEPEEFESLNMASKEGKKTGNRYNVLNIALDRKTGSREFNVCSKRAASSFYKSRSDVAYRFKDNEIERTINIPCMSVDDVAREKNSWPQFMTIDVEGAVIDLLVGAEDALSKSILGLRCEVEFAEIYQDAPLFDEAFKHFRERGYFLARIETCNAGLYGLTTDMNEYSVSPMDAMPLTADFILINKRLLATKMENTPSLIVSRELFILVIYCIHNGCGFLGLEIMDQLKEKSHLDYYLNHGEADEVKAFLSHVAVYLSIPRKVINKGFNGAEVFERLTDRDLKTIIADVKKEQAEKILNVYDEQLLFNRLMEPDGHYAFVPFS